MAEPNFSVKINLTEGIVELDGPDKDWVAEQLRQLEPIYSGGVTATPKPSSAPKPSAGPAQAPTSPEAPKPRRRGAGGATKAQVIDELKSLLTAEKKKALESYIGDRQVAFDKSKQSQAAIIATFLQDELDWKKVDANDLYTVYAMMGMEAPGNPIAQLNNAADRNKYFLGRVEGKRELSHKGENFGRTGSLNPRDAG